MILILAMVFNISTTNNALAQDNRCEKISRMAYLIMQKRQQEFSRVRLEQILEETVPDEKEQAAIRQLIKMAYEYPRFYTEENQEEAARKFANDVYGVCVD
jgi:hypothetical protein